MSRLTLRVRVLALLGVVVACFLALFAWAIHRQTRALLEEKRVATRHAVEAAHTAISHYAGRTRGPGALTEADAKALALAAVSSMRYGQGDYFWVNDLQPRMVMHPLKPELDGKDLTQNADPTGKRLFIEMADVCRRQGAGFVEYMWPKPGRDQPQPKISYVKLVPEWGWIVGSGIYVDDVDAQVRADMARVAVALLVVLAIVAALAWIAIGSIVAPVRQAVGVFRSGAAQIAAASGEVASTSQQLSQGASSQAASIEEISASMEEIGATTRANAERAARVAGLMGGIDGKVQASQPLLGELGAAMSALEASSRHVAKIIKTVDEIAFQTNILALNAAVEAARAGEAGQGFAVVADEVRSLAQRAAQAARDTASIVEASLGDAVRGAATAQAVSASIASFAGLVGEARALASEVDEASRQQEQGLAQVAASVTQMEQVTQATAAAAEESAAASEQLHAHSESSVGATLSLAALVGDAGTAAAARAPATPRRLDRRPHRVVRAA